MTSDQLLKHIKEISGKKQRFAPKAISVDTLVLALHTSEDELMFLINALQQQGDIEFQAAVSQRNRLGTVSLIDKSES